MNEQQTSVGPVRIGITHFFNWNHLTNEEFDMSNRQKMTWIVGFVCVLSIGIEHASAACPTFPDDFTCKCNGDETKWVCASWDGGGDPEEGIDFSVDYDCEGCSDAPLVTLLNADLDWELYSEVISSGAAANIGDIVLSNSGGDDFEVTIANGTGSGAANVDTIDLDDVSFTGYSTIKGGLIGGNLTGGLTVVQDSGGNGGEVTLVIVGDVSGPMTIPVLKSLIIDGDVSKKIDVTVEMDGTGFSTLGSFTTTGELEIADIVSGDIFFNKVSETFAGILDLENGIPSGTQVKFLTPLTADGVLDFGGGGVAGFLRILTDNAADVIDGGAVTGSATMSGGLTGDYSGSATFGSVSSTGSIGVGGVGDLEGAITVTGNMSGRISVSDDVTTSSGLIDVQGDLRGDITIGGEVGSDASVLVGGALVAPALGGIGTIVVTGTIAGIVSIDEQTDDKTLSQAVAGLTGKILVNDSEGNFDAGGSITIGPIVPPSPLNNVTFDGCIHIFDDSGGLTGGSLDGDVTVVGCHATDADLNICADGGDNGNIRIKQTGCANQVDWSCGTCTGT